LTRLARKKAFSPRNQVEFAIKTLCHIRSVFDIINASHSFFQKIKGLAGLADGLQILVFSNTNLPANTCQCLLRSCAQGVNRLKIGDNWGHGN
jgi:hypothetical protein